MDPMGIGVVPTLLNIAIIGSRLGTLNWLVVEPKPPGKGPNMSQCHVKHFQEIREIGWWSQPS